MMDGKGLMVDMMDSPDEVPYLVTASDFGCCSDLV